MIWRCFCWGISFSFSFCSGFRKCFFQTFLLLHVSLTFASSSASICLSLLLHLLSPFCCFLSHPWELLESSFPFPSSLVVDLSQALISCKWNWCCCWRFWCYFVSCLVFLFLAFCVLSFSSFPSSSTTASSCGCETSSCSAARTT